MDKMLYHAYKCLLFNEMLIEQCDGWLSVEEGNEYMVKRILKRNKEKKSNKKNV